MAREQGPQGNKVQDLIAGLLGWKGPKQPFFACGGWGSGEMFTKPGKGIEFLDNLLEKGNLALMLGRQLAFTEYFILSPGLIFSKASPVTQGL